MKKRQQRKKAAIAAAAASKNNEEGEDEIRSTGTEGDASDDIKVNIDSGDADGDVSSITSRLAPDNNVYRASRDISIKGVTISYGDKELLQHAELRFAYGHRYGLVGPNGIGKTTLLKMISSKRIPGFPIGFKVGYVQQDMDLKENLSIIEMVVASDTLRSGLLQKLSDLENSTSTSVDIVEEISKLYEQLEVIDSDSAEARAMSILSGLGFSPEMQAAPVSRLSGGWKMRASLACALFVNPDLLLLDEPTNHLDLHAVLWLQCYLSKKFKHTVLIVSHDREFLNTVVTDVVHFANQKLKYYPGDFRSFKRRQHEKILSQQRKQDKNEKEKKRILESIEKYKQQNRAHDCNQKMGMVRSRQIMLNKISDTEFIDGGWWKLFDMAWAWGGEALVVTPEQLDPSYRFKFPNPESLKTKGSIIQLKNVSFGYPSSKTKTLENVTIDIKPGSRIGVLGKNGSGKTTLLKLVTGDLKPTSGDIYRYPNAQIAYFSQHHVNQLDMGITPLAHLINLFPGQKEETVRAHLGSFGVGGKLALQPLNKLSGGQKSRVVFAIITWLEPHLIILDEPTNHLDFESIDALAIALKAYKGGLIVVSHDQHFLNEVVMSQTDGDEEGLLYVVRSTSKSATKFDGTIEDYRARVEKLVANSATPITTATATTTTTTNLSTATPKSTSSQSTKQSTPKRK